MQRFANSFRTLAIYVITLIIVLLAAATMIYSPISSMLMRQTDEANATLKPTFDITLTALANSIPSYFDVNDTANVQIHWETYNTGNIVPIDQIQLPDPVSKVAKDCGAKYAQAGVNSKYNYINVFCPFMLDTSATAAVPHLENQYFTQEAFDNIGPGYTYISTTYEPAIYKDPNKLELIRIGMPSWYLSPYPVLGEVKLVTYKRGDSTLLQQKIAKYFSDYVHRDVSVKDMTWVEGLSSFMVKDNGSYLYYSPGTKGLSARQALFFNQINCQSIYDGAPICKSEQEIDPHKPPSTK